MNRLFDSPTNSEAYLAERLIDTEEISDSETDDDDQYLTWRDYLFKTTHGPMGGFHAKCMKPKNDSVEEWGPVMEMLSKFGDSKVRHDIMKKKGEWELTGLHVLCMKKPPKRAVETLLLNCGNAIAKSLSKNRWLPLHFACRYGAGADVIKFLLQVGGYDTAAWQTVDGDTALHFACRFGQSVETVKVLLHSNSGIESVGIANRDGNTPLHLACEFGASREVVEIICDSCPIVKIGDSCCLGKVEKVAQMKNSDGNTPLHVACQFQPSRDLIEILLNKCGAGSLHVKNKRGEIPLHRACQFAASEEVIAVLIEGIDSIRIRVSRSSFSLIGKNRPTRVRNIYGEIPLHYACRHGASLDVIDILLAKNDKGTTLFEDRDKRLPLHIACENGASTDVVARLLDAGGSKTARHKDDSSRIPLFLACKSRASRDVVERLLKTGGDVTAFAVSVNSEDNTPLCMLKETYPDIAASIEQSFETIDEEDQSLFIEYLSKLSPELQDAYLCRCDVRDILNERFTHNSILPFAFADVYFQILAIVAYSSAVPYHIKYGSMETWTFVSLVLCLVWFFLREMVQYMTTSFKQLIEDFWNWLDWMQMGSIIYSLIIMSFNEKMTNVYYFIFTITTGLIWFMLLKPFRNFFQGFGIFITALFKITKELLPFMMTTSIFICSFAQMFYVTDLKTSFWDECDKEDAFCNTGGSLKNICLWLIGMLFGGMEVSPTDSSVRGTSLLYGYGFVMGIVLLNVLIAKISNVFTMVDQESEKYFWQNRLDFIAELYALERYIPGWFANQDVEETNWFWEKVIKNCNKESFRDDYNNDYKMLFTFHVKGGRWWRNELLTVLIRFLAILNFSYNFFTGIVLFGILWPKWVRAMILYGERMRKVESSQLEEQIKSLAQANELEKQNKCIKTQLEVIKKQNETILAILMKKKGKETR